MKKRSVQFAIQIPTKSISQPMFKETTRQNGHYIYLFFQCQCMEDENGDVSCNYVPKSIGTGTTIQAGFFTQAQCNFIF